MLGLYLITDINKKTNLIDILQFERSFRILTVCRTIDKYLYSRIFSDAVHF